MDEEAVYPIHGQPIDLDQDGDIDVLMAFGMGFADDPAAEQICWYENDGSPRDGGWKKRIIHQGFYGAFEAVAGDLDGDRDLDVIATAWREPGQVAWFENSGDAKGPWTLHLIKNKFSNVNQVIVADLDGNGAIDVVACASGALELRWWRNQGRVDF